MLLLLRPDQHIGVTPDWQAVDMDCPSCEQGLVLHLICKSSGRDFWRCDSCLMVWTEREAVDTDPGMASSEFLSLQGIREADVQELPSE